MIVDFHTHVFPDKIAKKTIDFLSKKAGIPPFSDGSVCGLLGEMERGGVDVAVALPVLTSPSQYESVNRFAAEKNLEFLQSARRIISFAGIHPRCDDIEGKMREIRERGFLGVKLHPDYQETFINDEGYIKILECANKEGLIVSVHSGVDGGYRGMPVRCTPSLVCEVIERTRPKRLVLAHYGANEMFDGVYERLAGKNVYFDTSYILSYIDETCFKRILAKHGDDKVLFASDSPWSGIAESVDRIRSFSLGEQTEKKIFSKNALRLLGI